MIQEAEDVSPQDRQWHLDKRVPIAMIVAIALQTAGALWWAATISTRVEFLDRQITPIATQVERIIRLETQLHAINENIQELKVILRSRQTIP